MNGGAELAAMVDLESSADARVAVDLAYDQLQHELDTRLELSPQEELAATYFSCVRAVRHDTLASRMGFVLEVARNVAHEHRRRLNRRATTSLDELPQEYLLAGVNEERQRVPEILARRAVERLSNPDRTMLIEHCLEGLSWTEIAQRHGISSDKAKKGVSRALSKVSSAILGGERGVPEGVGRRLVTWLKEMLPDV
jgi:DNA-directed RNA polymerase specialized sigma24 family protein